MRTIFYKISGVILILTLSTTTWAYNNMGFFSRAKGLIWAWVAGTNTPVPSGTYTSIGVASPTNYPSAREGHVTWTDTSGNFWIFGGSGYDSAGNQGMLNDLWKYNTATGDWTWVYGSGVTYTSGIYGTKGVTGTGNGPGSRDNATSWVDSSGNLWLFGGMGIDSAGSNAELNDLWKFTISTGKWTWMAGSNLTIQSGIYGTKGTSTVATCPGARWQNQQSSWVDTTGNLWLFGGVGYGSLGSYGSLNDLWKFNPSTGQWTWMSGSNTINGNATYGTKGTGSTLNVPGARAETSVWTDSSGYVWVFGGEGRDSSGTTGYLNDLWRFEISTSKWTWMSGSNLKGAFGTYGTQGASSASNTPGARYTSAGVIDSGGKLILFGGFGYDSTGNIDTLGDLWSFDPTTSQWMWISGNNFSGQMGDYGSVNVTSGTNLIGTRENPVIGLDSSSNLWIFGGRGANSSHTLAYLNDLWKYNFSSQQWTWTGGTSDSPYMPSFGNLGVPDNTNNPGARLESMNTADPSGDLWLFGGGGVDAGDYVQQMNDLWRYSPTTKQWTWMSGSIYGNSSGVYGTKGTGSTSNTPGSRSGGVMWADGSGYVWLFGGYGSDYLGSFGQLNDLWKFEVATKKWTWVHGSKTASALGTYGTRGTGTTLTVPGGRYGGAAWVDGSGNFWLYGGEGYDSTGTPGSLNDLWRFQPGVNTWTWISGKNVANQSGTYGTKGTGSTANTPGSRSEASSWYDRNGNVWFFGGYGYDRVGSFSLLNDLWKYTPGTDQWTWVGGSDLVDQSSVYGTKGVANTANAPGARYASPMWKDAQGNFYLMGGYAKYSGGSGAGNDIWKYNPNINQWAWIGGSQTLMPLGNYGTLGIGSPGNIPSGRYWGASWSTPGALWYFGGNSGISPHNDLWRIQAK